MNEELSAKEIARLVAQGYTQEEGIDYDEVFAHVARIEAIRLFLAYASFKDFVMYQMDVKSVFLYWKIKEKVNVLSTQDLKLQISVELIRLKNFNKFGFPEVKTARTPNGNKKSFCKVKMSEEVAVHMYRSKSLKVSHLYAVKRIFRYTDSDYARVSLDRNVYNRRWLQCWK
ncbi:copia protein [Tanacetum coccineum]